jgi:hypothetical protein
VALKPTLGMFCSVGANNLACRIVKKRQAICLRKGLGKNSWPRMFNARQTKSLGMSLGMCTRNMDSVNVID